MEQFVHLILLFWCTITHIRNVGTLKGHQHQMPRMIGSETTQTTAFVGQNTVQSWERSLYRRSPDRQQQQVSPKCTWECGIHSAVLRWRCYCYHYVLQTTDHHLYLWINSHSFWSSCEDALRTWAMLLKSCVGIFCWRTSCKLQRLRSIVWAGPQPAQAPPRCSKM